ncbi:hypothetical protein KCTC32516_00537 [Polaribacter huanghezhanensis]|uniref:hypothetical protein n=1 Tax=Polaribacter huanghezhanensis TaxID=1354726 RepID=UPI0026498A25|nr:hypothetical protein [Polaribacter huanghezhanensis]WKD85197.1 hypothetical protein KCTC32516_00537 [Polaribacter huanghezhanensis]
MKNKGQKKFTVGISYEKHLIEAQETYTKDVLPHLDKNKKAYEEHLKENKEQVLTSTQKAQLSCLNPI